MPRSWVRTIPILHQHIFGLFLTHSPYVSINITECQQKNCNFSDIKTAQFLGLLIIGMVSYQKFKKLHRHKIFNVNWWFLQGLRMPEPVSAKPVPKLRAKSATKASGRPRPKTIHVDQDADVNTALQQSRGPRGSISNISGMTDYFRA